MLLCNNAFGSSNMMEKEIKCISTCEQPCTTATLLEVFFGRFRRWFLGRIWSWFWGLLGNNTFRSSDMMEKEKKCISMCKQPCTTATSLEIENIHQNPFLTFGLVFFWVLSFGLVVEHGWRALPLSLLVVPCHWALMFIRPCCWAYSLCLVVGSCFCALSSGVVIVLCFFALLMFLVVGSCCWALLLGNVIEPCHRFLSLCLIICLAFLLGLVVEPYCWASLLGLVIGSCHCASVCWALLLDLVIRWTLSCVGPHYLLSLVIGWCKEKSNISNSLFMYVLCIKETF